VLLPPPIVVIIIIISLACQSRLSRVPSHAHPVESLSLFRLFFVLCCVVFWSLFFVFFLLCVSVLKKFCPLLFFLSHVCFVSRLFFFSFFFSCVCQKIRLSVHRIKSENDSWYLSHFFKNFSRHASSAQLL